MSEWLFRRESPKNGLTHTRARTLIQQEHISSHERSALTEHLAECEECGGYGAMHVYLSHNLILEPVRTTIAPELKITLMNRIRSQNRRAQIMKPIYAVAGVVVLAAVVIVAWLAIGAISEQEEPSIAGVPTEGSLSPTAELVETSAAVLEQDAATATVAPTETTIPATLEPTAIIEPQLSYQSFDVGDDIYDIVVADFNGDGSPDVALTDYEQGATHVVLNDGGGSFLEPTTYQTGEASIALAAADLNNDSHIDLAIASDETETIGVLINNGDGTFMEPVLYAAGPNPSWVQTGDMNGDSFIDLVIAHEPELVGVMLNNGDGTFSESVQYFAGRRAGNGSAHAGDLDGDGDLDVAVRHMPDALVSVLMNNGDGTLSEPAEYEACFNPMWLTMGDLNQDDALDLLVPCDSGVVSILFNNGDGTYTYSVDIESGGNTKDVRIAELNGDGLPDLLIGPTANSLMSSYKNYGDGTFQVLKEYPYQDYPDLYMIYAFPITDVDGDGLRDVIGISGGSKVVVIPIESSE